MDRSIIQSIEKMKYEINGIFTNSRFERGEYDDFFDT